MNFCALIISHPRGVRGESHGHTREIPRNLITFVANSNLKITFVLVTRIPVAVDLHLSKVLFSLDPDNLQLHCFLGLGALFCCSFFCPLNEPCKTLQMVWAPRPRDL